MTGNLITQGLGANAGFLLTLGLNLPTVRTIVGRRLTLVGVSRQASLLVGTEQRTMRLAGTNQTTLVCSDKGNVNA